MAIDNTVTLSGNLTRDPEVTYTPNGKQVTKTGMAVNRRWTGQDGKPVEQVSFFNLVLWGEVGDNVATSLSKGARVLVCGRLEHRSWKVEEKDGTEGTRSTVEIIVDDIGPSLRWANCQVQKVDRVHGEGPAARQPVAANGAPAAAEPDFADEPF